RMADPITAGPAQQNETRAEAEKDGKPESAKFWLAELSASPAQVCRWHIASVAQSANGSITSEADQRAAAQFDPWRKWGRQSLCGDTVSAVDHRVRRHGGAMRRPALKDQPLLCCLGPPLM